MTPEQLLRVKELFLAASELPADQRIAWLDQNVSSGPVRDKVLRQLACFEGDSDDLCMGFAAGSVLVEPVPRSIGPYRVLERIGEGGMGVVYRAQQTEPVNRIVAVKRIKPGMDSRAVLGRFESERRVLARLEHPGIARVVDAGVDDAGRPYFAMEFVDGPSITDYCDRQKLDPDQRLALFMDVCRGVEHAHQRGILHRDLKPANVLVAEVDGQPVPKIIDFGVAKALRPGIDLRSLHTQLGLLIGTPEYMSPEQADPVHTPADTRSDVYSLGVLLYELLSGRLPFESSRLHDAGLSGIVRVLREELPQRPSTQVRTSVPGAADHARLRRSDPRSLMSRLRGDLDWITMRALRKAPEERYASAGALAQDLQRHLDGLPVEAGPPTWSYRLSKGIRRHRGKVLAGCLVAASLVGGTMVSLWFAFDAARRAEEANRAQVSAERSAAEARVQRDAARGVTDVLTGALSLFDPDRSAGDTQRDDALMVRAATLARTDLESQPLIEAELLTVIGRAASVRGEFRNATAWLRRAHRRLAEGECTPEQLHSVLWPYSWTLWYTSGVASVAAWRSAVIQARVAACIGCPDLDRPLRELRSWVDPFYRYELDDPGATIQKIRTLAESSYEPRDTRWIPLADFVIACADRSVIKQQPVAVSERLFDLAVEMYTAGGSLDAAHSRLAQAREMLLHRWFEVGREGRGRAEATAALEALADRLPEQHWQLAHFRAWIALADVRAAPTDSEAVGRLRAEVDRLLDAVGPGCRSTMAPLVALIEHLEKTRGPKSAEPYRDALLSAVARRRPEESRWCALAVGDESSQLRSALLELDRRARFEAPPEETAELFDAVVEFANGLPSDDLDRRMAVGQALVACYDRVHRKPFVAAFSDTARRVLNYCVDTSSGAGDDYSCYASFYLSEFLMPEDPIKAEQLLERDADEREERWGDFYFARLNRFQVAKARALRGESVLPQVREHLRWMEREFGVLDYNSRPSFEQAMELHRTADEQRDFSRFAAGTLREMLRGGTPPAFLARTAWAVVRAPGARVDDCEKALSAAQAALAIEDRLPWRFIVGVAQCRAGRFDEAIATLESVQAARDRAGEPPDANDALFLALSLVGRKDTAVAREQLDAARRLIADRATPEQSAWIEEVEAAVRR